MVAPVLVALGRAAAKQAVKSSAKKAVAKKAAKSASRKAGSLSSKARKLGDESTIARKRYYRASERYLKEAEKTSGTTAARYRQLARQNFEDALSTYDPTNTQKFSKPMQRLAAEFGYDLEGERQLPESETERKRVISQRQTRQERAVYDASENVLSGTLRDPDKRRQLEAETLFKSSEIGQRIIGGYSDVWREEAEYIDPETGEKKINTKKIFSALFKHFGVDNLADLVEKVEGEIGEILYKMGNSEEMYETVKLAINKNVLRNEAVA